MCLDSYIKFIDGRLVTEINIFYKGELPKGHNLGNTQVGGISNKSLAIKSTANQSGK